MQESDSKVFDAISKNNTTELITLLNENPDAVNITDQDGMTPLQHAAYKGNKEMVQALLDRGADIDGGHHSYNYTALHFGALSGNSAMVRLLMDAGAKAEVKNTVGRTASQMAAFVGNYHTVWTINHFIPRSHISSLSVPTGSPKEALVSPVLVDPLHNFVMEVNVNPIRILMNLQRYPGLADNLEVTRTVMHLLSKKYMNVETNEVMSFKFHYFEYIVNEVIKIRERYMKDKEGAIDENKKFDFVEVFSKRLLKPGKDGVLEYMDGFLKDGIREFPYRDCVIFHQMVSSLSSKDSPPALGAIQVSINGHRGFTEGVVYCDTCGEEKPAKKCSKCRSVAYCDRECQRLHWFVHKKACSREAPAQARATLATRSDVDAAELSAQLQNLVSR